MRENKIKPSLEAMKLLRTILIILINTKPLTEVSTSLSFFLSNVLALGGIPYLFVVCGYSLSLELKYSNNKKETFINNLKSTFKVYVIWSLVYFVFYDLNYLNFSTLSNFEILTTYLRKFFILGFHFHLWYLPALIVTMVLVYVGYTYNKEKELLTLSIILYIIALLGSTYFNLIKNIPLINSIYTTYNIYFLTFKNGVFYGFIFGQIGAYISKNKTNLNKNSSLKLTILTLILLTGEVILLSNITSVNDFYIILVPFSYFFFNHLLTIDLNIKKDTALIIRDYGSKIYCIQGIFLIIFKDFNITSTTYFLLVLMSAFISVFIIRKIKYLLDKLLSGQRQLV